MADTGTVVIGAGVVGLAVAARLAQSGDDVVLLERHPRHGQETSSRNSEVIHGGMYYPTGSLKARLCVEGNRMLYEICERGGVPHARVGKLIVATTPHEMEALEKLLVLGQANGVEMSLLTGAGVAAMEPEVRSVGALWSPNTGIVSAHGLMDHFFHEARTAGAVVQPRAEVVGIARRGAEYEIATRGAAGDEVLTAERVVNSAGLESDRMAALAGIDVAAAGYALHYVKGSYFSVSPRKSRLVSRLVYPVPGHVSLGVHAVIGLEGRLRMGPDAEYLPDRVCNYAVDESLRAQFGEATRRLIPAITAEDLTPDISGIRPKLQAPGEPARDFVIAEESARGLPGFVNLIGIDSPGLTSSPAIADYVATLLR
jgi:L-2-hydroxyglutarate oxidase LhgO